MFFINIGFLDANGMIMHLAVVKSSRGFVRDENTPGHVIVFDFLQMRKDYFRLVIRVVSAQNINQTLDFFLVLYVCLDNLLFKKTKQFIHSHFY